LYHTAIFLSHSGLEGDPQIANVYRDFGVVARAGVQPATFALGSLRSKDRYWHAPMSLSRLRHLPLRRTSYASCSSPRDKDLNHIPDHRRGVDIRIAYPQFRSRRTHVPLSAERGFNEGSITASLGSKTTFTNQPCPINTISYDVQNPFHGGNTGSNPVGDANKIKHLHDSFWD